jgi:hypothetical protein
VPALEGAALDGHGVFGGRKAEDAHAAAVGEEHSHGDADQRGLRCPVAAEQAGDLARLHREGNAVQRRLAFLKERSIS